MSFTLRFPSGVIATGDCSFGTAESRRCRVQGADCIIEMDPAFAYRGMRLSVKKGGQRAAPALTEVDHFAAEMEHFSECVLTNAEPRTPGADGLADLRVIEAIDRAARTGRTEAVRR